MKKLLFVYLTLTFCPNLSIAQENYKNVEITFGDKNYLAGYQSSVLGSVKTNDGYIILNKEILVRKSIYRLSKLNFDLELIYTKDVSEQFKTTDKYRVDFERLEKVGDSYCLITKKYVADFEQTGIFYNLGDIKTGELADKKLWFKTEFFAKTNYAVTLSPDSDYLLLAKYSSYLDDPDISLELRIFDQDMEEVWSYESLKLVTEHPKYTIRDIHLTNDARIYLYGDEFIDDGDPKRPLITAINANDDTENSVIIYRDNGRRVNATESKFLILNDSLVYLTGYYYYTGAINTNPATANLKSTLRTDGVFRFKLNPNTGKINERIWSEFEKETSKEETSVGSNAANVYEYGVSNRDNYLNLQNTIIHEDQSISLVGHLNKSGYSNFRIIKLDPQGNMVSDSDYYFFFDKLMFGLNDDILVPRKLRKSEINKLDISKEEKKKLIGSVLSVQIIGADGKVITKSLVDYKSAIYDKPFTIQSPGKELIFEEDEFTDVFKKTHFGKAKHGWVRIRFLEE